MKSVFRNRWRVAGNLGATAVSLVPHSARFELSRRFARLVSGILAPSLRRRRRGVVVWATPLDETLRAAFVALTRNRITFDPQILVDISPAAEECFGAGLLMVSGHFPLNPLVTRYLHDRGCRPVILRTASEENGVWGKAAAVFESPALSPMILLKVRRYLREGHVVQLAVDRAAPDPGTTPVETSAGTTFVMTTIFRYAARLGVPLLFACGRTTRDSQATIIIRRIEPTLDAYAAELRTQIDAVMANRGEMPPPP